MRNKPLNLINQDSGIYTLLCAIILVALLLLIGLALDTGKLQLDHTRLQRAVDSGAIVAGLEIGNLVKTDVELLAKSVAEDNILISNLNGVDTLANMPNPTSIDVTGREQSNTNFYGKIFPGKSDHVLTSIASSTKRPVALVLVLDISGSMDTTVPGSWGTRLDALKTASKAFISSFSESQDAVSLVVFSDSAKVIYPLTKGFSSTEIGGLIDSLKSSGWTNTHSGLLVARQQLSLLPTVVGNGYESYLKSVVLITDGAPNRNNGGHYPTGCPSDSNKPDLVYPILESDKLRSEGALVFGIGLGWQDPNSVSAFQTQPTSTSPGTYLLKRFMFKRLVNDPSGTQDPNFPSECFSGYSDISYLPVGRYLESANVSDIHYMLGQVGLAIRMRLTR